MKKPGRPSKLNADTTARIATLIRAGNYIETAAAQAGIASSTCREWLRRGRIDLDAGRESDYAAFADEVDRAHASSEALLVTGIATHAKTDWRAAAFLLERKMPLRWGSRQQADVEVRMTVVEMAREHLERARRGVK